MSGRSFFGRFKCRLDKSKGRTREKQRYCELKRGTVVFNSFFNYSFHFPFPFSFLPEQQLISTFEHSFPPFQKLYGKVQVYREKNNKK